MPPEEHLIQVPLCAGDGPIAPTLVKQGLIPCAPYYPTVAFTVRTLELFHAERMRNPRLGKQGFLRSLNDLHGIAPKPYLQKQFTAAYDVYLHAREVLRIRVETAANRNVENWRLENACPCCLYKVEGEAVLDPPFFAMDGNNSLKRVDRREYHTTEDGKRVPGPSVEAIDNRKPPRDYYIPRRRLTASPRRTSRRR
jgi:hypothetical protein